MDDIIAYLSGDIDTLPDPVATQPLPPASLATLKSIGKVRDTRPTMAGAHLADLTEPQKIAMEFGSHLALVDGEVRMFLALGPLASRATLRALERKGYGELTYQSGRHDRRRVPTGLALNGRGRRTHERLTLGVAA